jgi:hypothetical protein
MDIISLQKSLPNEEAEHRAATAGGVDGRVGDADETGEGGKLRLYFLSPSTAGPDHKTRLERRVSSRSESSDHRSTSAGAYERVPGARR